MAKLTTLKTGLSSIAPRINSNAQTREQQRAVEEPWRNWYKLKRWLDLRMEVFKRDMFTCFECKRLEGDTSQLVAHHKIPHKGNVRLFWDIANLEAVSKEWHDTVAQSEERGAMTGGPIYVSSTGERLP